MKRVLVLAPLLILLIFGAARTAPLFEISAPKATPQSTAVLKGMLEGERRKLQQYEQKLGDTEKRISLIESKGGDDASADAAVAGLLSKVDELKQKVLQSRVNVRELEILLGEEH
jgi:hypothetical protein